MVLPCSYLYFFRFLRARITQQCTQARFFYLLIISLYIIYYTGEKCSSYEALNVAELKKGNCKKIVNGTDGNWLTVRCRIPNYRPYTYFRLCRLKLCRHFTLCLGQSSEWETLCSRKFYRFHNSQFDISTAAGGINGSYFRNIHVRFCGARPRDIDIKITEFQCKTRNTKRGMQEEPFAFLIFFFLFLFNLLR